MRSAIMAGSTVLLLAVSPAFCAIINVGTHQLNPNESGQQIQIAVNGTENIQGVVFNVQVADGYPAVDGSSVDGPNITDVDLIAPGTVFGDVSNNGNNDIAATPQAWTVGTSTGSGTVPADGVLGILTIDTTGWSSGTWPLMLDGTFNGDTNFQSPTGQIYPEITNGWIKIGSGSPVPEPSMMVMTIWAIGLGLVFAWRRRRRTA